MRASWQRLRCPALYDEIERSNENLNSTCTLKNDLYDDFEE